MQRSKGLYDLHAWLAKCEYSLEVDDTRGTEADGSCQVLESSTILSAKLTAVLEETVTMVRLVTPSPLLSWLIENAKYLVPSYRMGSHSLFRGFDHPY